jgi:ubiquinone biosynthesis protein COQ4
MAKIHWRAVGAELGRLRENPEDIEAGARLFLALGGMDDERDVARLRSSERGRQLLSERPDLLAALTDRERLRALPDGTLGREYLRFAEREQIFPEGIDQMMTKVQGVPPDRDAAYLRSRGRSLHDLLHVLTGYGRDPAGEIALLAFSAVQNETGALDWLSLLGCFKALLRGRIEILRLRRHGRRRAREAPWMLEQPWESLLERPIDEVRRELRLWPVPRYEPIDIADLAARGSRGTARFTTPPLGPR